MRSPSVLRFVGLLVGPVLLIGSSVWVRALSSPTGSPTPRYAEEPPLGHTGGFGEPTCHACHFGGAVNEGGGELTVDGLSTPVRSGHTYELTVTLRASMERSGFMLALRRPDGTQAGRLAPVDSGRVTARTVDSTGVQYVHHTGTGTNLAETDRATWTVRWTAPASADSVVAHAVANAANDDASEFGDDVYTTTVQAAVEP